MIQASIKKLSEKKLNTHQINVVEWVLGESEPFIELESLLVFYTLVDLRLDIPLCLRPASVYIRSATAMLGRVIIPSFNMPTNMPTLGGK